MNMQELQHEKAGLVETIIEDALSEIRGASYSYQKSVLSVMNRQVEQVQSCWSEDQLQEVSHNLQRNCHIKTCTRCYKTKEVIE